ncbi:SRP-independent targeting protein 2/TMEM208 [Trinorchestia longiramus]|nr:SRP-independent targeting protein 2/TMEM208 [Trinorchestia longiramus]
MKERARGQKQVLEENVSTLSFYRIMTIAVVAGYGFFYWMFFNNCSVTDYVMMVMCSCLLAASNFFLSSMACVKRSSSGEVLDPGCDLNIEGGIAEHVKDAIILTSTTVALSCISSYFWLLLLFAPLRAGQMLWTNFIGPWIFSGSEPIESDPALDERALKKQKKLERRQKRGY